MMRGYTLLVLGCGVNGQGQLWYSALYMKRCGHDADYIFCYAISFKLHMLDDERKNPY